MEKYDYIAIYESDGNTSVRRHLTFQKALSAIVEGTINVFYDSYDIDMNELEHILKKEWSDDKSNKVSIVKDIVFSSSIVRYTLEFDREKEHISSSLDGEFYFYLAVEESPDEEPQELKTDKQKESYVLLLNQKQLFSVKVADDFPSALEKCVEWTKQLLQESDINPSNFGILKDFYYTGLKIGIEDSIFNGREFHFDFNYDEEGFTSHLDGRFLIELAKPEQ